MTVFKGPAKGQTLLMDLSPEGQRRILAGLSWNAIPIKDYSPTPEYPKSNKWYTNLWNHLKYSGKDSYRGAKLYNTTRQYEKESQKDDDKPGRDTGYGHHDVDLYCYIFDNSGNFVGRVGPESEEMIDASSKIYHSGEDFSGSGGNDDETVHIETASIPSEYKHLFFVITSDSKFSLDETSGLFFRIADSRSDHDFFRTMIRPAANLDAFSYVSVHLYKDIENSWKIKNIDDFLADRDESNQATIEWPSYLKRYINT